MQKGLMYVLASALLVWTSALLPAQSAPAATAGPPASPQAGLKLAPGTVLGAELSKGIDAKKAKVGQEVQAKSLTDLRDPNGNVVIPRGTKLVGHVTQVKAASKQEPQSSLAILFDKAEVKRGQEVGMRAAVQALEGPPPSPAAPQGGAEEPGEAPGGAPGGGGQPSMGPGGRTGGGMPGSSPGRQGQTGDMGGTTGEAAPQTGRTAPAPQLNANSRGVIGIPNLTLSPQASPTEGAVISSNHGNVKLNGGTLMVLRVIGE